MPEPRFIDFPFAHHRLLVGRLGNPQLHFFHHIRVTLWRSHFSWTPSSRYLPDNALW
jgi:hypothetical protein